MILSDEMNTEKVWMEEIPLEKIDFIDNVRLDEDVNTLMLSIKSQGLLEPVGLLANKEKNGRYILIFGYKRFKAVKNLGWTKIRAMISDIKFTSEKEMERYLIYTNLTENTYEKPSPIEQGRKYDVLINKFGMSVSEIHALTGEPEGAINDDLLMYKIVPEKFRGDVTRQRGNSEKEGKLPVNVVKTLSAKLKNYKMGQAESMDIWEYVKSHDTSNAELTIIMEIMFRLGKSFNEAAKLAESCHSINLRYILNKDVEIELQKQYGKSITDIVELVVKGKLPPIPNLIMNKSPSQRKGKK